jgi:hypothetical protein
MCVDYVLASPRIAQVDPGDEPPSEVVLSQLVPDLVSCPHAHQQNGTTERKHRHIVVMGLACPPSHNLHAPQILGPSLPHSHALDQ